MKITSALSYATYINLCYPRRRAKKITNFEVLRKNNLANLAVDFKANARIEEPHEDIARIRILGGILSSNERQYRATASIIMSQWQILAR